MSEESPLALLSLLTVVLYFLAMPQRVSLDFTTCTLPLLVDLVATLFVFVVFLEVELEAVAREDDELEGFDFGLVVTTGGGGGASVYS